MDGLWVGLDVGEKETRTCVTDESGQVVFEGFCPTSQFDLDRVLAPYRNDIQIVGMEPGVGTHLTRQLRALGYPVVVYEGQKAKRFLSVRRNKTDTFDARGIADLARVGDSVVSQVHVKSVGLQHLRTQLVLRQKLIRDRVASESLIQAIFCLYGGRRLLFRNGSITREDVENELARIEAEARIPIREEVLPLFELCRVIRSYLTHLNQKLSDIAEKNEVCARFMEIPGVGPIGALSFYTAVEDPHRFSRTSDIGAFLGLTPRVSQSGDYSKRLGITKMGDKRARTLLVTAATCLLRKSTRDSKLRDWGLELAGRIGMPKARVAVARKLAVIMLRMWKAGESFQPYPAEVEDRHQRSPTGAADLDPGRRSQL